MILRGTNGMTTIYIIIENVNVSRMRNYTITRVPLNIRAYMTVGKAYQDTSKPQKSSTCNDSHAKCFIMTNSTAKLSPGAVNRGEFESVFLSFSRCVST